MSYCANCKTLANQFTLEVNMDRGKQYATCCVGGFPMAEAETPQKMRRKEAFARKSSHLLQML